MTWPSATLGELCDLRNGKAYNANDWSKNGYPIVRIQNLNDSSKPFNHWAGTLQKQVHVTAGDLLLAWAGTPGTSFGAHIWRGPEGVLNQHIFKIALNESRLTKEWLKFCINIQILSLISQAQGGVGLKHVTKGMVEGLDIPLPPMNEQKRIVEMLDKADAIRRKCQQVLRLTEDFLRSVFLDMFGDPVTNPKGWDCEELQNVVKDGTIVTYGIVQAGEEFSGGVPYIRTGDMSDGVIVEEGLRHTDPKIAAKFDRSRVEYGDIVMSIRATVGTTALVPESLHGANLTQGTARISPGNRALLSYLHCYLRSEGVQNWIQGQVKGATFREITLGRLRELPVLLPPVSLQKDFERIFQRLSGKKIRHETTLVESNNLVAALQQRAFRGEL